MVGIATGFLINNNSFGAILALLSIGMFTISLFFWSQDEEVKQ